MPLSIGVVFPEAVAADVPLPDPARIARHAEQAGLDCVWAEDRLADQEMCVPDAPLSLAAAAAVTEHIGVGFAVYVPSRRPLVWAAKQIASLQHISGGRLQLGIGIGGGDDHEYEVAGYRVADRARRTDEFLRLLPELLEGQPAQVPDLPGTPTVRLLPPAPLPPIWIGGTSTAALRRAARFGTGWLSGFQSPGEFAASATRLSGLAAESGRPDLRLGISVHATLGTGHGLARDTADFLQRSYGMPPDRARQLAVGGTPDEVADQLAAFVQAGAEVIAVGCRPALSPQAVDLVAEVGSRLRQH